jgi:hypothetical protein
MFASGPRSRPRAGARSPPERLSSACSRAGQSLSASPEGKPVSRRPVCPLLQLTYQTYPLTKTINRYGRVDLLCVDELGYMELDRRGAELLFQVLTEREEKASVAIASNESGSLDQDLHRPRLCAAIVDRLTFGGNIIETGTNSYRLAATRAAQQH